MGLRAHVSQRQRRLGLELRKLRDIAGVTRADAARQAGIHSPHLSNIEAGRTACPEQRLRALATIYGCTNKPLLECLIELSKATGRGWWTSRKALLEDRIIDLAELESTTVAHRSFQWLYVPGLLQTPDYMRVLFRKSQPTASPDLIDEYVQFRLRRQVVLTEDPAPAYHAVIHEAAFHMNFCGNKIMQEQLTYLVELSQFPNINIQVLPFSADAHPATPGAPFSIMDARVPELATVYVEHPVSSVFLDDRAHLDQFATDFARLSTVSLAPLDVAAPFGEGSFGLVQHLLYVLKEGKHVGP